ARKTERGKIILFQNLVHEFAVPALAVRHRKAEPVCGVVARKPFGFGLLVPEGRVEAATAAEARIEVAKVDAHERVVHARVRIATRRDASDARFFEHLRRDAADEKIYGLRSDRCVLTYAEHADAQGACPSGQLQASIERERPAVVVETDA